jgi:hypothetical protein
MNLNTSKPAAFKPIAAASRVLPQRQTPVLPIAPRQPFRVLHANRAPEQLSLFLRPTLGAR